MASAARVRVRSRARSAQVYSVARTTRPRKMMRIPGPGSTSMISPAPQSVNPAEMTSSRFAVDAILRLRWAGVGVRMVTSFRGTRCPFEGLSAHLEPGCRGRSRSVVAAVPWLGYSPSPVTVALLRQTCNGCHGPMCGVGWWVKGSIPSSCCRHYGFSARQRGPAPCGSGETFGQQPLCDRRNPPPCRTSFSLQPWCPSSRNGTASLAQPCWRGWRLSRRGV